MKSSSGAGRDASDAATQEVAVAEHRLVAVEELGAALAVGQARCDAAHEDPDQDVSVAVAPHHRAAVVAITDAQRAELRGVNLEDGVGAELDVEEHARGRALADRVVGLAVTPIADRLHIAANGRLLGDELRGLREIDGALEDQVGDVEFPERARVERIRVPGDVVASVVRARGGAAPTTVFLPGLCSNANAYLQAFPEAARRQGGVVAIEGDQACGNLEGFRSFSWDASKLHARIEAAAAAAGLQAVPREGLTLVGYSQGAALGEQLVQRWPTRYARVVLIGAPTEPSAARFAEARAVVTMSCSRDVPSKMREATNRFVRAGIPSTYLEMPDCTHGNITDGDRTFDAAFDWLRANARPPKADAKPQPLIGEG